MDADRHAVDLCIIKIILLFRHKVIPALPSARYQHHRQKHRGQALLPASAHIVALQLLALYAEHGGDDAQQGRAFTVVVNADPDNVFFLAQFGKIIGKALLHRVIALIDNKGDHAVNIAVALQKVFQFSIEVLGVCLRRAGADDDQIFG